jgi:hypothetical protein
MGAVAAERLQERDLRGLCVAGQVVRDERAVPDAVFAHRGSLAAIVEHRKQELDTADLARGPAGG